MLVEVKKVEISVTVPMETVNEMREEVCKVGAGIVGNYTNCSYLVKGLGTFKPNNKANPHIGEKNKLEFVEEAKLEVVCDIENVKSVVSKIREVHPYEEPLILIIPLIDENSFN